MLEKENNISNPLEKFTVEKYFVNTKMEVAAVPTFDFSDKINANVSRFLRLCQRDDKNNPKQQSKFFCSISSHIFLAVLN